MNGRMDICIYLAIIYLCIWREDSLWMCVAKNLLFTIQVKGEEWAEGIVEDF